MNRLDHRHLASRVTLSSVVAQEPSPEIVRRRISPLMMEVFGVLGFVCYGAVIVAAAGLIALQIQ